MRYWLINSFMAFGLTVSLLAHASFADEEALSIVRLAFRDHIVTISSSSQGLLYSVRTRSGELLAENLTDQELLAAHPQLYSRIRSGYATDDSGSFIWAGRDEPLIEPPADFSIEIE